MGVPEPGGCPQAVERAAGVLGVRVVGAARGVERADGGAEQGGGFGGRAVGGEVGTEAALGLGDLPVAGGEREGEEGAWRGGPFEHFHDAGVVG